MGKTLKMPKNFQALDTGIIRGGRPNFKQLLELQDQGVETVINLEFGWRAWLLGQVNQEADNCFRLKIRFLNLQFRSFRAPNSMELNLVADMLELYRAQRVYVHCLHGSDRTGFAVAAWRIKHLGWSYQQSKNELKQHFHTWAYWWWLPRLKRFAEEFQNG